MPNEMENLRKVLKAGGVKSWILDADPEQLSELFELTKTGVSSSILLQKTKYDWMITPENYSEKQVLRDLLTFKIRLFPDTTSLVIAQAKEGHPLALQANAKMEDLVSTLDGMGRLGWLINEQTKRVQKSIEKEGALLFDSTNKAMNALRIMLEKYIKFEMATGLRDKVPEKHEHNLSGTFSMLADAGALGSPALLEEMSQRFLELAANKVTTLKSVDGGAYQLVEDEENGDTVKCSSSG
jgi:hypothetical protein